jgi:hypothetical protein
MMHEFISSEVNIINLAIWWNMLTYVISEIQDNQSYVKFMTISSSTSRVRCMKLRPICIDWCMNLCYFQIYIYGESILGIC